MMFHRFSHNHTMMSMSASASCANANRSCARSASANRSIIAVLDAIIMASFIILSLHGILGLALICLPVIILLVSVLVLVRLVVRTVKRFRQRRDRFFVWLLRISHDCEARREYLYNIVNF